MPRGPGKYDDHATAVRVALEAEAVVLIVIGGDDGGGFSVQAPLGFTKKLPRILRDLADTIAQDVKGL